MFFELDISYFGLVASTTLYLFLYAISITFTAYSISTVLSACKMIAGSSCPVSSNLILALGFQFLLVYRQYSSHSGVIETESVCFSKVRALLLGKSSFNAFGLTSVDVSIKKINNKKTMSVMEDMLKFATDLISTS